MPFNVGDIIELVPGVTDSYDLASMNVNYGDLLRVTNVEYPQEGPYATIKFERVDGKECFSGWYARRFQLVQAYTEASTPYSQVIRVIHKIKKKREALGYQW